MNIFSKVIQKIKGFGTAAWGLLRKQAPKYLDLIEAAAIAEVRVITSMDWEDPATKAAALREVANSAVALGLKIKDQFVGVGIDDLLSRYSVADVQRFLGVVRTASTVVTAYVGKGDPRLGLMMALLNTAVEQAYLKLTAAARAKRLAAIGLD